MTKHSFAEDNFLITEPEKHPGVVLEVPAGLAPVSLGTVGYRADPEVRCAFCRNRQWHSYGFFAVLPDGSLALCGNCCAIEIAGKSTVAEIKRDIKRREEISASRKDLALLRPRLKPVIELLERNWVPVEHMVHRHVRRLKECFPAIKPPGLAKLSAVAAGLCEIVDPPFGSPLNLTEMKKKRARALDMITEGLTEIRREHAKLDVDHVQQLVDREDLIHGYPRTQLLRRTLLVLERPSFTDKHVMDGRMKVHMDLPEINLPDAGPLIEAVEVARLAVTSSSVSIQVRRQSCE